jgi:hypothetical protein
MRLELNNDNDFDGADFWRGTVCAVCHKPITEPPASWIAKSSLDFFLHKDCEPLFTLEIVQKALGDMVLVMQDSSFHDVPPERN